MAGVITPEEALRRLDVTELAVNEVRRRLDRSETHAAATSTQLAATLQGQQLQEAADASVQRA